MRFKMAMINNSIYRWCKVTYSLRIFIFFIVKEERKNSSLNIIVAITTVFRIQPDSDWIFLKQWHNERSYLDAETSKNKIKLHQNLYPNGKAVLYGRSRLIKSFDSSSSQPIPTIKLTKRYAYTHWDLISLYKN